MADRTDRLDPEEFLTHADFVRRIAKSVSADIHDADEDDVVQETWLAALRRPPSGDLRAWLRRVARNVALETRRRARRRRPREHAVARPTTVPATAEILEREAARRVVVDAVLNLPEAYRSVLLLRFYEDLPPRQVAQRLGLPVETIRTRYKRGLAILRRRLDEHFDDHQAWLSLLPIGQTPLGGPLPSLVLLASMKKTTEAALALVLLLVLFATFYFVGARTPTPAEDPPHPMIAQSHEIGSDEPDVSAAESDPSVGHRELVEPTRVTLHGRIIAFDRNGKTYDDEAGTLSLLRLSADDQPLDPESHSVRFTNGRFALDLLASPRLAVRSLRFHGSQTSITLSNWNFPAHETITLRVQRDPPAHLKVVDAESRSMLTDVDVVDVRDLELQSCGHPGDLDRRRYAVRQQRSPVSILRHGAVQTYLVSAPGHAWTEFEVCHRDGGDRLVSLSAAAELRVTTCNLPIGLEVFFRLAKSIRGEDLDLPVVHVIARRDQSRVFRRLPPGSYVAVPSARHDCNR